MSFDLKWNGEEILRLIREGTPEGLFEAGEMLVDAAKAKAPTSSGDLKDSAYVATEQRSTYKSGKKNRRETKPPKGGAVAGFASFYAKFHEYGTKHLGARPFLRPAYDSLRDKMASTIAITIGKKLK